MPDSFRSNRNTGPRNPDGTLVGGMAVGPYKPFPFPVGFTQGDLTVVRWESNGKGWHPVVSCSCGWEGMVDRHNFKAGRSTRCNQCAKRRSAATRKKYWGYADIIPADEHRQRLLNRIGACITRCHSAGDKRYQHYGGRGIKVFKPWRTGTAGRRKFLAYLVTLEGWDIPHYELDRIDNNKGYEPGNLRFCSRRKNVANRRSVAELQAQVDDLRYQLRRANEQIHCDDGVWPDFGA